MKSLIGAACVVIFAIAIIAIQNTQNYARLNSLERRVDSVIRNQRAMDSFMKIQYSIDTLLGKRIDKIDAIAHTHKAK